MARKSYWGNLLGIGLLQEGTPELLRVLAVREDRDSLPAHRSGDKLFLKGTVSRDKLFLYI